MRIVFGKKVKFVFWTVFPVLAGIFFSSLIFNGVLGNTDYKKVKQADETGNSTLAPLAEKEKVPRNFYFIKDPKQKPKVGALSYLVGDLDTGEIIFAKEKEQRFPIASVSKLVTATVATELANGNDVTTVSKKALDTYGKNGNLKAGEKIKVEDLLYPLLMESSNDAGEIIAEYFDREIFIKKMNKLSARLGLSKTRFEDPSGLSPLNQSTVSDMFKLAGYINQKMPELLQITQKRSHTTTKHSWLSNNQFLQEKGYLGGKSGYTDPARQTVISLFAMPLSESGTRNIAIVLLQSKDRFTDVKNILQYLKKNVYYGGEKDAGTAWVKEKEKIAEITESDFVSLIFGGDIMLDRGVRNSVQKNWGGDYSMLFEKLGILKKADIIFANLEGPASDIGQDKRNLYSFRMNPSTIPALKGAGFSVLSVANNHAGDWGRDAYADTLTRLKENEILYTGGGHTEFEAETPTVIEQSGMKLGFLGFSDVGPEWMKAKQETTGLLLASNPRFDEIVANASKQVDYLIVSFHFGDEYKTTHNERQEYLAHKAIDAGAKIVIGHHPHVVQDTEVYKDGFIAYSLGNLIFDQGFSENTMQGMLLEMKLWRDGDIYVKKNTVKLNKFFQPEKVIVGKEEKIKFGE